MQDSWPVLLLLLVAAAIVIVLQSRWLGQQRDRGRTNEATAEREAERRSAAHARSLRAVDGERDAAALLEGAGYSVLGQQVPGSWTVRADGEPVTFGLRADYVVSRRGRRYIAEVKTGRLAPRLSHGPTRRQLLEYSAAFDVHGVLLVDADLQTLTHVEVDVFADRAPRRHGWSRGSRAAFVAIAAFLLFATGIVVGTAIRRPAVRDRANPAKPVSSRSAILGS